VSATARKTTHTRVIVELCMNSFIVALIRPVIVIAEHLIPIFSFVVSILFVLLREVEILSCCCGFTL